VKTYEGNFAGNLHGEIPANILNPVPNSTMDHDDDDTAIRLHILDHARARRE
jgi:hypothetical protein